MRMGWKEANHGNTTIVFNLQCVKLILSELFFSLSLDCPEWPTPEAYACGQQ